MVVLDPRPDLREDSRLWEAVLSAADDPMLRGLLHGLRCAGARLERRPSGSLKLDYRPLLGIWGEEELLRDWLEPNRAGIAATFRRAVRSDAA